MAELDVSGTEELCPNWMTHVSPQNGLPQELAESFLEPERSPELPVQTPQQLLQQAKSTSLTPLLKCCQLQTPATLSIEADCHRTLFPGTITWTAPLAWLEQSLPDSPVLASLRQSIRFPILKQDQSTSITPISATSAATSTTPLNLLEAGVNTSLEESASTKDSTAETDSLLWHCSRDQLSRLSRLELERRLESILIIMEALSHQMQDYQKFHQPSAQVGLADQREAATQTPISDLKEEEQMYHDLYVALRKRYQALQQSHKSEQILAQKLANVAKEMREWPSDSRKLQDIVDTAFLHIQEDRRALHQQQELMRGFLSRCQGMVQRSCQDKKDMKARLEKALKDKEEAYLLMESVRTHAGAKIEDLKQSSKSQQHLQALLEEAYGHQVDLSNGYAKYVEKGDRLAAAMQEDWAQMQLDVCDKLEASTVELVGALGKVNQLTETNTCLQKEFEAMLLKATTAEGELERLQQEREILAQHLAEKEKSLEEMTRVLQEKEPEWEKMQRDLREAVDCREFMEQESQVVQNQLKETEEHLKATFATLLERSTHLEDLKDAYETLQQEQEAVGKELASTKAELQSYEVGMEKFSKTVLDIRAVQAQILETADFIKAAMLGKLMAVAQRSRTCTPSRQTPHRLGASFVDTILQAAAEKDVETPMSLWSDSSAFTKATPTGPLTPAEVEESLATCILELQEAAGQLHSLTCEHQKTKQEEVRSLQAENLRLEHLLESQALQLQAEVDSSNASIAKLNKALRVSLQNEKELQGILQEQDEKLKLQTDQSGKVMNLQEEVAQLKHTLQIAETESFALWEELKGKKQSDIDWVQEKICLRQEVRKLRELLIEKDNEKTELVAKYLGQVKSLENQLHHTQQVLRQHRRTEAEMKELLDTLPADVANTPEMKHFLQLFQ
ncbi:hypothetical protein lerEdw1_002648 [Lerista edwardsae]|nr:hypothetical protein lerEdw1_002648 [Lerista edwardsae]